MHNNIRFFSKTTYRPAFLLSCCIILLTNMSFAQFYHLHRKMTGHTGWIWSVACSPKDNIVASGSADNTVKLWDISMGICFLTLRGHTLDVYSVAFSSDGKLLVSGSEDNTVKVWDTKTGECVHTLSGHTSWVHGVAFSPDAKLIASVSGDNTCRLWDVESGKSIAVLRGHTGAVWTVAFSPDGKYLATGSSDKTVKIWDIAQKSVTQTLKGHDGAVRCVTFNPSGALVASGGRDNAVIIWRVRTGEKVNTLQGHKGWIEDLVFTSDGVTLISGSGDKSLRVWSTASGQCNQILANHEREVLSVSLNSNGLRLISGSCDNKINVWKRLRLHRYTNYYKLKISGKTYEVIDVEYPGEPRAKVVIDEEGKPIKNREILEQVLNAGDVIGFYKEPEYRKERFKYFIGSEVQPRIGALKMFIDEIPNNDLITWWRTEPNAAKILAATKSSFLIGSDMAAKIKEEIPHEYAELAVEKFMRDPVVFFTALSQAVIVDGLNRLQWIETKCEEVRDDDVIDVNEYNQISDAYWDAVIYASTMDYIYNKMQKEMTGDLATIVQENRTKLMSSLSASTRAVPAAKIGIQFGEILEMSKLYSAFHQEVKNRWKLKQQEAYELWKKERINRAIKLADKVAKGI
jgi:WD40 repeat protein